MYVRECHVGIDEPNKSPEVLGQHHAQNRDTENLNGLHALEFVVDMVTGFSHHPGEYLLLAI